MKPITADEIRSIAEFDAVREQMRARVIALKKARRVALGDRVSIVFENRETLLWQIHEMVRVEGITRREAVAHECDTYSALLPSRSHLSATLFIELPPGANIRAELDRLIGLDEKVALVVGGQSVGAEFDSSQMSEERISAVHYLKFRFSDAQRTKFLDRSVAAALRIEHPAYRVEAPVDGETRRELCADLA